MIIQNRSRGLAALPITFALLATTAFSVPSMAATTMTTTHHKKNWVQRHPTATGFAAGIATHHALKVQAARDKARGKKLNWAERHPTMTGLGAGLATRHIIKKHTAH